MHRCCQAFNSVQLTAFWAVALGQHNLLLALQSTMFNALCENGKAQAANFPFCTIEPNVGLVAVPDPRLDVLSKLSKSGVVTGTPAGRRTQTSVAFTSYPHQLRIMTAALHPHGDACPLCCTITSSCVRMPVVSACATLRAAFSRRCAVRAAGSPRREAGPHQRGVCGHCGAGEGGL